MDSAMVPSSHAIGQCVKESVIKRHGNDHAMLLMVLVVIGKKDEDENDTQNVGYDTMAGMYEWNSNGVV